MKLKILNQCPICESFKIFKLSNIKSNITEILNTFDLMKCLECSHRFISKIPSQKELDNLYEIDSPIVFGKTDYNQLQKNNFIKSNSKDIIPDNSNWIFKHIKIDNGKYFELGPGLCSLYKAFQLKGWKCQGLELRSFVQIEGIKKKIQDIEFDNDIVVAFDVLEHLVDPVEYLKKISYRTKKDGMIFLTYPNSESFKSRILKDKWQMVSPLAHIHFFSEKSSKIMLEKCNFEIVLIQDYSFVEPRRLMRNFIKLPILIFKDILRVKIKNIPFRFAEIVLNILDLIKGDQLKVIAKKK